MWQIIGKAIWSPIEKQPKDIDTCNTAIQFPAVEIIIFFQFIVDIFPPFPRSVDWSKKYVRLKRKIWLSMWGHWRLPYGSVRELNWTRNQTKSRTGWMSYVNGLNISHIWTLESVRHVIDRFPNWYESYGKDGSIIDFQTISFWYRFCEAASMIWTWRNIRSIYSSPCAQWCPK